MSAETVCRVCLVNNLNLYDVGKDLQNSYERIMREKYNKVGYPLCMCYICLSVLRKCHRFMETARDTNRLLKQCSNQQTEMRVAKPLYTYSLTKVELASSKNEHILLEQDIKTENMAEQLAGDIKSDNSEGCQDMEEIEIKPENETNQEIQLLCLNEAPGELNIDIKIQEREESDEDLLVTNDECYADDFSTLNPKPDNLKSKKKQGKKKSKKRPRHVTCDVCNKSYKSIYCLRRHIITKHLSTKLNTKKKLNQNMATYSCNECTYKCNKKALLIRHLRIHTGEKPFACDVCSYKFSEKSHLIRHLRTHTGEKPFSCDICKYKSRCKSSLIRHMRTHTGEKPFLCEICSYRCIRTAQLTSHMLSHTGEKPFSCKICTFKCAQITKLTKHAKIHTGEKKFSCDICSFKCLGKTNLTVHMRTHTGEKPFSCDICNYKSSRKSTLKTHMITHTGEKPFSCDKCEYKCLHRTRLTNHMRKH